MQVVSENPLFSLTFLSGLPLAYDFVAFQIE